MGKSYKRWEETGIYADTYELVKAVHSVIYDFPKKDRVVIGDKMIDKATSMIAYSGMAYKLADKRLECIDRFICEFEILKTYLRMAKKRNNYKRLMEYKELGLRLFGKYMCWNEKKQCFNMLPKYSFKNVLKRQYKLTI